MSVLLEFRAEALHRRGPPDRGSPSPWFRDRRTRPLPRRPRLGVPRPAGGASPRDARLRRAVACHGLPLARDASALGVDAPPRLRLRLVLPRHRSLRATGRWLLHLAPVL